MINIKIYCNKKHPDYNKIYEIIENVMLENNLNYQIERISEPKAIQRHNIIHEPHIAINNQVVYANARYQPEKLKMILQKMKLIK
ncbi:MAG: thioredoxin family protein [Acetobacter sp.]|nr:thioredoxin family protein [Acetobacter sp.]